MDEFTFTLTVRGKNKDDILGWLNKGRADPEWLKEVTRLVLGERGNRDIWDQLNAQYHEGGGTVEPPVIDTLPLVNIGIRQFDGGRYSFNFTGPALTYFLIYVPETAQPGQEGVINVYEYALGQVALKMYVGDKIGVRYPFPGYGEGNSTHVELIVGNSTLSKLGVQPGQMLIVSIIPERMQGELSVAPGVAWGYAITCHPIR